MVVGCGGGNCFEVEVLLRLVLVVVFVLVMVVLEFFLVMVLVVVKVLLEFFHLSFSSAGSTMAMILAQSLCVIYFGTG